MRTGGAHVRHIHVAVIRAWIVAVKDNKTWYGWCYAYLQVHLALHIIELSFVDRISFWRLLAERSVKVLVYCRTYIPAIFSFTSTKCNTDVRRCRCQSSLAQPTNDNQRSNQPEWIVLDHPQVRHKDLVVPASCKELKRECILLGLTLRGYRSNLWSCRNKDS